jgi:hypothetical protein
MRVEQAIKMLSDNYQPNDDIYIEWWGKEVLDPDGENPISDDDWAVAVSIVEDNPSEWAMGIIFDQLESALYDQKKDKV